MATEIVGQAPKAFTGWDSSVFLEWMKAVTDLMMSGGRTDLMAPTTLGNVGGLLNALTEAIDELAASETMAAREANA